MATFYFYSNPKLHLCNRVFICTDESFVKLKEKGRISEERKEILTLLVRYRLLTEEMLAVLTGNDMKSLQGNLSALMEYGLVIKQFYECRDGEQDIRTETFYAASANLPKGAVEDEREFRWSEELRLSTAMGILAFNQFHIALIKNVPKKHLQAQTCYKVKDIMVDGRYRLRGRCFQKGYAHVFVIPVRDEAERKLKIPEILLQIRERFAYGEEKLPWVILLCEHKKQCAYLNKKIRSSTDFKDMIVYFLLDTDIEYDENPFHYLQKYRFANGEQEIITDVFTVKDWWK